MASLGAIGQFAGADFEIQRTSETTEKLEGKGNPLRAGGREGSTRCDVVANWNICSHFRAARHPWPF
jgi:hypothetical protein